MAHVNLLPWREKQRQLQKQNYLAMLGAVALIVGAICWGIGKGIDNQISNQHARNQFLQQQISVLDSQIAEIQKIKESKKAIEQRMALIEQLQISRNVAPSVFDELARIVPAGVSFQTMKRMGNQIEITGLSDSNNRLSDFMRRLENSEVFTGGELSSIKADTSASDAVSDFTLKFRISPEISPPLDQPEKGAK
ncbi:PilN domain-containing protein [Alteromonas sp. C1M14]|uniref:PilN domain-containing protein n=1 Tax=Alteromonas sp. C1M14 TaxID=2841567 RepID=UPI001C081B79|nr:PilN domain-containing protein [Alteromonas sp. C1M14]MBU2978647.1 PilN domain-containing protein [Alteromonas sp. C1M14]